MKMRYCSTLTIALLACAASLQAATKISVWMKNGTKSDIVMADNGKMDVHSGSLNIQSAPTAKFTVFPMEDIRKVTFERVDTGLDQNSADEAIAVFPNPVKDRMFLSNVKEGAQLSIYNLQGTLVAEMAYSEAGVDLSALAAGSYVISVNGVSIKVNKL
ncbi:MAG: T9SS type A sorting domain-containing protein [Paludibacteraceae bacterium]|nr:T9SS type A sorting domain-containing protein [Paludibacteraceae bacterium]